MLKNFCDAIFDSSIVKIFAGANKVNLFKAQYEIDKLIYELILCFVPKKKKRFYKTNHRNFE